MRLLFLDVDGVLNSNKSSLLKGGIPWSVSNLPPEGSATPIVQPKEWIDFDAAQLINKLIEATDCDIVVSSSWRVGYTLPEVMRVMEALGIRRDRVIGRTDELGPKRGTEILRYVTDADSEAGRKFLCDRGLMHESFRSCTDAEVESYVIIDDDATMLKSQSHNFVQTTFDDGLTLADAVRAGRILTGNKNFQSLDFFKKPEDTNSIIS